jgi:hypothetical protein
VDFYVIHDYPYGDTSTPDHFDMLGSSIDRLPRIGADVWQIIQENAPGGELDVAMTEYNSFWGKPPESVAQTLNMLFLADSLGQFIEQEFRYANHWAIIDGGDNSRLGFLLEHQGLYRQPSYYAFPLWAHTGELRLASRTNRHKGFELSAYATREEGSGDVLLMIINKIEATSGTIEIENFTPSGTVEAYVAQGKDLDDSSVIFNGLENPPLDLQAVAPLTQAIASSVFSYTVPAYSLTSLRIKAMQSIYLPLVIANANSPCRMRSTCRSRVLGPS